MNWAKLLPSIAIILLISACSKPIDIKDSHGHTIHLSDYRGKWIYLNYWASWCKPCTREMPALNALYQGNRDNMVVLGVSYDKLSSEEINQVAKKQAIQYPMLATFPLDKMGIPHLNVLPITFIINPKGRLVKTLKGPQTERQLKHAIDDIRQ
jgi:peroxiredoxin